MICAGAVVFAWHVAHWATWMFEIANYSDSEFNFSKGGFQGARGANRGKEFYIENVFEEMDSESEWFYNESTQMLYYYNNQSQLNQTFEATHLKVLFSITLHTAHQSA